MKSRLFILFGVGSLLLGLAMGDRSLADIGDDPNFGPQGCTFAQLTGELGPDGSITYKVMGDCSYGTITGQMTYSTNQQMAEKFRYGQAVITSSATCPSDPWIANVTCQDPSILVRDAQANDKFLDYPVPLSAWVPNARLAFQRARANATRPKPPGAPVNAKAEMRPYVGNGARATVSWLAPDQQGQFGPFLNFVVEARPAKAEGAAWVRLGSVAHHTTQDYRLTVQLPPPVRGTTGWELRACSTTVFASTCTMPLVPTISPIIQRQYHKSFKDMIVASPHSPTGSSSVLQLPKSAVTAPPGPAGPVQGARPKSSIGQSSALNPQPLPPKSLGSILRRGVDEEKIEPSEPTPAK